MFSSLSESGFIPTWSCVLEKKDTSFSFSSLSESGFIPTETKEFLWDLEVPEVLISFREWLHSYLYFSQETREFLWEFSSLSESGFIPTWWIHIYWFRTNSEVLISFREWLHSYTRNKARLPAATGHCSHLFQRVASFLQSFLWLLKERDLTLFSSLSESGFIPTKEAGLVVRSRRFIVLISFREWLHSY